MVLIFAFFVNKIFTLLLIFRVKTEILFWKMALFDAKLHEGN